MCYTFFCWFNIAERVSPRMMCRWGQSIHRKFKRWWAWSSRCKLLCIRYISGSPHHVSGAQPWLWHVEYYAICYSHRRGWTEITDVMTHWEQCITWSLQIFTVQCVSWHCWMEPSNSVIGPQAVAMVQGLDQQVNVWRCMCSGSATSSLHYMQVSDKLVSSICIGLPTAISNCCIDAAAAHWFNYACILSDITMLDIGFVVWGRSACHFT